MPSSASTPPGISPLSLHDALPILLLLTGACGKSAQLPLYVWLPDAMEGPTPVSSLIHAATMVTAGVYMVARSNTIFNRAPVALTARSEEHTSELQSRFDLVCRLLLRRPPGSPLFPYTTLFRSCCC